MHRIASSQGGVGQLNNTVASATVDSLNPNCIPISCLELKAWDPFLKPTFPAAHLQGCHNGRFWVKMTVRTSTRIHVYPADAVKIASARTLAFSRTRPRVRTDVGLRGPVPVRTWRGRELGDLGDRKPNIFYSLLQ
jgi:hypothetical protein